MKFEVGKFYTHPKLMDTLIQVIAVYDFSNGVRYGIRWFTKGGRYIAEEECVFPNIEEWKEC